ncbi:HSP70/90 co-chaperone [Xanthoria parietina]
MSRIQELPDDYNSSNPLPPSTETPFPISTKSKAQNASSATAPSLPPAMDSVRSHTADEIVQMTKRTPLFMTNLDEATGAEGEDVEENVELEALRALQYEGTRAEIALGFKERGNEMVGEKRWGDAKEFYTKGILALRERSERQGEQSNNDGAGGGDGDGSEQEEMEKERKIEEACYVNRALCNLELKNYRTTLTDTSHTLLLAPTNTKAHYRSTLALLALAKHDLALDTCTRGLALTSPTLISTNIAMQPSPEHLAFQTLRSRILAAKTESENQQSVRRAADEKRRREQLTLSAAITARGIKVRWTGQPPDLEDAKVHLEPDPLSATSEVFWPVLVLYPLVGESDFLKGVGETASVADIVGTVLGEGLRWDGEGEG